MQREQQIKKEQEIIVNEIEVKCTQLNNEELKLELDRTNLLLSIKKVSNPDIRSSLKAKIVESSPIRKKATESFSGIQEKLNSILINKEELEGENKELIQKLSTLQKAKEECEQELSKWRELLEKERNGAKKMKQSLHKVEDELELAKQGIVRPDKKIHIAYIAFILILLGCFFIYRSAQGKKSKEAESPASIILALPQSNQLNDSIDAVIGKLTTIHPELQKILDGYKKNDVKSIYRLAKCFELGDFLQGNRNTLLAGKLVRIAAERGYENAQNTLGFYFFYGKAGYRLNYDSACVWYTKAIENGCVDALYNLAVAYADGRYTGIRQTTKKTSEAISLYEKSANEGHEKSPLVLGKYCYGKKLYKKAKEWFETCLSRNQTNSDKAIAQFYMGQLYGSDHLGAEKNYNIAFEWYKKSAENGHIEAAYYLGKYYQEGIGVSQNSSEATKWLTRAKELGDKETSENAKRRLERGVHKSGIQKKK